MPKLQPDLKNAGVAILASCGYKAVVGRDGYAHDVVCVGSFHDMCLFQYLAGCFKGKDAVDDECLQ
jgi:hypothetical protein